VSTHGNQAFVAEYRGPVTGLWAPVSRRWSTPATRSPATARC
jgi:hypothetical protein